MGDLESGIWDLGFGIEDKGEEGVRIFFFFISFLRTFTSSLVWPTWPGLAWPKVAAIKKLPLLSRGKGGGGVVVLFFIGK